MKGINLLLFLKEVTSEEESNENTGTTSPTPTPQTEKTSIRDRILSGLKRAGLATGLALVAILGLVFVLTRPK
jgi:hypothetical protein